MSTCYVSSTFLTSHLIQQPGQQGMGWGPASSAPSAHQETEGQKAQGLLVGRDLNSVLNSVFSFPFPVTSSPYQPCLPEPKVSATPCISGCRGLNTLGDGQ